MKDFIIGLFRPDQNPRRGLLAIEWLIMGYTFITLLIILFTYTKVHNPEFMIWGRVQNITMMLALWGVYRMLPCRFTHFCRILLQLALLSWWYPDTYELNRIFPNLDHWFALFDQKIFGFQPALYFYDKINNVVFSELMCLGYASYYPMIVFVCLYYFIKRYDAFDKIAFIILGSFFSYYLIFVLLPVAGPQFYYPAVGIDHIASGIFPNVHDYFATHQTCLEVPGYNNGFFHQLVVDAHNAGERPTAAFPSSHVGISTVLMILAWQSHNKSLFYGLLPLYVLLCFSTVYIRAHYAVDVFGGLISAVCFFFILSWIYERCNPSGSGKVARK